MSLHYPVRQLDIKKKDHVKQIILDVESDQNKKRKEDAWVSFQVDQGNQYEYVKKALEELYPDSAHKFRKADISVCKKVLDKKNKAYKVTPIRTLDTDNETTNLNEMYAKYEFDRSFKEADRIYNRHKYVAMWLAWQNPNPSLGIIEGRYKLHALAPYEYDITRDPKTGEVIHFILSYPDTDITRQAGGSDGIEQTIAESQSDTSAQSKVYAIWSKSTFVKVIVKRSEHALDSDGLVMQYIQIEPNQAGVLPVTFLSSDNAVDYPIPSNLAKQSINWNVALADLKTAAANQGHGQLVVKHPSGQKVKKFYMGMHTAITLPQDRKAAESGISTDANYINPNPDLTGQLEVLKFDLLNILDEHGVQAKSSIEGADVAKSGFDRLLKEADVQDVIEDNQGLYADVLEQGVYFILRAYERALNKTSFTSEVVNVTFEKPKVLISDKETLENIKLRDELGLILPHEKHLIINPNLSEEEAKARVELIEELKRERVEAFINSTEVVEDEEEDEEIEG